MESRQALNMKRLLALLVAVAPLPVLGAITFNLDHVDVSSFVAKGTITFYLDYLDDSYRVVEPAPTPDSFEVFGNGDLMKGKVEVVRYSEVDEAVAVALVLGAHADYTAPITGDEAESALSLFDLEKDAAKAFIQKLESGSNDRVAVFFYYENILDPAVPFGSSMNTAQSTLEQYTLKQRSEKVGVDGNPLAPKLYRYIKEVIEDHMAGGDLPRRRVLVVMSDGRDTDAENPKKVQKRIADIVEPAKADQIKIYTVGYSLDTPKYLSDFGRLAAGTGGVARSIQTRDTSTTPDVAGAFEEVGDELKKQLIVRFTPDDIEDGRYYKFKIKLKSPEASSEFYREVPVPELPMRWKAWLIWGGVGLGGLVLVFLLVKLIGALVRSRRERADAAPEQQDYNGPSKGRLVVTDGPYAGQVFHLTEEVTRFGSMAGNHVVLQDQAVSKRHCAIRIDEEKLRYELADLGSTNGTFANDQKVTKCFLKDGDVIRVGTTKMAFHLK
jgi:hypothetical protein